MCVCEGGREGCVYVFFLFIKDINMSCKHDGHKQVTVYKIFLAVSFIIIQISPFCVTVFNSVYVTIHYLRCRFHGRNDQANFKKPKKNQISQY